MLSGGLVYGTGYDEARGIVEGSACLPWDFGLLKLLATLASYLTAFVIVMEMTDSHEMVLPLMATAFIAHVSSRLVCDRPLYKTLAQNFLAAAGGPAQDTSPSK